MKISIGINWRDWWVGVYLSKDHKTVFICPIPCVVISATKEKREPILLWIKKFCGGYSNERYYPSYMRPPRITNKEKCAVCGGYGVVVVAGAQTHYCPECYPGPF